MPRETLIVRRLRRLLRAQKPSAFTLFAALTLAVCALATAFSYSSGWRAPRPEARGPARLPARVLTVRGLMDTEEEYLPGVVDCEMAFYTEAPSALAAQAIAARTYLARYLALQGEGAVVPMGPHFQCWRPVVYQRSREAVRATRGMVLRWGGDLITANYAAGARARDDKCQPASPRVHGLTQASWSAVRRAWENGTRFSGPAWTEIFVTDNGGRRGRAVQQTGLSRTSPANRGALGQHAAICWAERLGADTESILRRFYGDDVVLAR